VLYCYKLKVRTEEPIKYGNKLKPTVALLLSKLDLN